MPPYKPQHAVACAHCRELVDGDLACQGCKRPVCRRCATPETCGRPRARVIRLGRGARLRAVDPEGGIGLVSTWTGKLKLWDLAAARDLGDFGPTRWLGDSPRFAGLLRDRSVADYRSLFVDGVWLCNCGAHDVLSSQEHVEVTGAGVYVQPLPGSLINQAAYDCRTGLLAVATHDRLAAFRCEPGGRLERIGSARIEGEPVCWLGAAGDRVVSLTRAGRRGRLRAYRCATSVFYPLPFYEWIGGEHPELRFRPIDAPPADPAAPLDDDLGLARDQHIEIEPVRAAMSSDGKTAAIALRGSLVAVHDLDGGRVSLYGDHSDGLCCVSLPAGGRLLISGDHDNRVIVRERDGRDFSRWLVDV